jgi:hypothetical protein
VNAARAGTIVFALVALLGSVPAAAHTLGQSYSIWRLDGDLLATTFNMPLASLELLAADLDARADPVEAVAAYVVASLKPDGRCETAREPVVAMLPRAGFLRVELRWRSRRAGWRWIAPARRCAARPAPPAARWHA